MAKRVVAFEFEEIEGIINIIGVRCDGTETDPVPVPPSKAMIGTIVTVAIKPSLLPGHLLLCDGSNYNGEAYPELFALLDDAFIDGDTFYVPDLTSRTVIGATGTFPVNASGGAFEHTLTIAEIPAHNHTALDHNHGIPNHTHTTVAHTHTQNPHGHVGNAHNHSISDPQHSHGINHNHAMQARSNSAAGTNAELMRSNGTGTDADFNTGLSSLNPTGNASTGISVDNSVVSVQNTAAVNQNSTVVVNEAVLNVNLASVPIENTGGGAAHNNMQPYRALHYAIVARAG